MRTGEETASLIEEEKKKPKWTNPIMIFASVLGLIINISLTPRVSVVVINFSAQKQISPTATNFYQLQPAY
jgi:hypothetical protein